MPRTPPAAQPPTLELKPPDPWTVKLQTITPMFGGSAEPRQANPEHPIRAASVRGHLRFWWRATAGAGYKTEKELFDAESEIWGRVPQPLKDKDGKPKIDPHAHGKVRLEVEVTDAGQECEPIRHVSRDGRARLDFGNYPAYALFPFQGNIKHGRTDEPPTKAREKVAFAVTLTLNGLSTEQRSEVKRALHAWVMFGGIGARTRRGCGSLQLVESEAGKPNAPTGLPTLLTTLPATYFLGETTQDPTAAWRDAVNAYQRFRQGEGEARTPRPAGSKTPGRSYWPEPDRIRLIRNKYFDGYDKSGNYKKHEPDKEAFGFPRADLGLPIIFHFKDEGQSRKHDPTDQELRGDAEGRTRFASPVITKAIAVPGGYAPMVMILDAPRIWDGPPVVLVDSKSQHRGATRIEIAELQAAQRKKQPLPSSDIREALKIFLRNVQYLQRGSPTGKKMFLHEVTL